MQDKSGNAVADLIFFDVMLFVDVGGGRRSHVYPGYLFF